MNDLERLSATLRPLYSIERPVGRATFGDAYRVATEDGATAELVLLDQTIVDAMPHPARFVRGMEQVGRVAHPALVRIHGAGITSSGGVYYTREVVPGRSGKALLAESGPLPSEQVAAAGVALAGALSAAHAAGLVQGVLTPAVVHFAADGIRMSGLGVHAALAAAGVPVPVLMEHTRLRPYLPPEIAAGWPLDRRTDIYALGVMLYELLIGRPPFGGRATATTMVAVLADGAFDTSGAKGGRSERVAAAILRAIEKRPDDRWATMADFAAAIDAGSEELGGRSRKSSAGRRGCLPILAAGVAIGGLIGRILM